MSVASSDGVFEVPKMSNELCRSWQTISEQASVGLTVKAVNYGSRWKKCSPCSRSVLQYTRDRSKVCTADAGQILSQQHTRRVRVHMERAPD